MAAPINREAANQPASFSLGYGDYLRFSKLLLDRCGLYFSENRRSELEYRLGMAFSASTCASLDEFYALLQDPTIGAVEMDTLINSATVSETHFFRDAAQFDALYYHVLPRIIERKRSIRTLRIWSAGCASGEEPYSIALLLRELIPDIDNWSITILGTDINTASLDRARAGVYGSWAFREERAIGTRSRYFRQSGNRFELDPEVRSMVLFKKLNLVEPCYPSFETNTSMMDMILCRNVTIYFNEMITRWVVDRFYDALVEGGWLVVGHSEPSLEIYRRFRVRNFPDSILYQRMPETTSLHWPPASPSAAYPVHIPPPPVFTTNSSPAPALTAGLVPPADPIPPASEVISSQAKENPIEHARELLEYGRANDALALLKGLAVGGPASSEVFYLLGQTHADLGNLQEAEMWCIKALEADHLSLNAFYTLSLVYQHKGKLGQAIDFMKKVVYIDRNYILGHYGLANLYHDSGLVPQAQKSLDNTLKLLSGKPEDQVIPDSRGVMVGRLREAVIRQQQAWSIPSR